MPRRPNLKTFDKLAKFRKKPAMKSVAPSGPMSMPDRSSRPSLGGLQSKIAGKLTKMGFGKVKA